MQDAENAEPIAAVATMEAAARAVVDATATIARPSDVTEIIEALSRVQQVMSQIYDGLGQWHGKAELGVHHGGEKSTGDPHNPGWIRAEIALGEASQYGSDAVAALERARIANMSARWFDEIRDDGV